MSDLPKLVQRAPAFFYAGAIIYFIASVLLAHLQLQEAYRGVADSEVVFSRFDAHSRLALLSSVLQAFEVALYLAGTGVIAQILLAIWRKGRSADVEGSE